jgi:hypothetical protein
MIKAKTAKRKEQEFNRDLWIRLSIKRLSKAIDREAAKGLNALSVNLHNIVIGAENLAEIGEMCILIEKELKMNGYRIHYSIDGELTISW